MSERKKFKHCPHCGEEKEIASINIHLTNGWYVVCRKCGAQTSLYKEEREAIDAWNLRAPMRGLNNWMKLQAIMVTNLSNQVDQTDTWLSKVFEAIATAKATESVDELMQQWVIFDKIKADWLKGAENNGR